MTQPPPKRSVAKRASKTVSPPPRVLTSAQARTHLLSHLGLLRPASGDIVGLLQKHRCIQLDPLDRVGNSADLFAAARLDDTRRGDVYAAVQPGHAFEHMFKVRCLLPAAFLPHYRKQLRETGWFSYQHMCPTPEDLHLADVLTEIRERGPLCQHEMTDRGMGAKKSDHPWARKTTVNMISIDVLEARGDLVIVGRTSKGKRYELAERAFPNLDWSEPSESWAEFTVRERTQAAGLLSLNAGPWWTLARDVRVAARKDVRLHSEVEPVVIEGFRRSYLAPREALAALSTPSAAGEFVHEGDDRMRVLGPLDPLLWDRDLVRHIWNFDYVWEVYKPKAKRRWGYYVCPLLHHGRLVGRFEAHRESNADGSSTVVVDHVWPESGDGADGRPARAFDRAAFDRCMARLDAAQ